MEDVTTPNSVPDASQLNAAEGTGADKDAIQLAKLNEYLGKDFKDVDTALKSVKDTFSYVGKQDNLRQAVKQVIEKTGKDEQTVLTTLEKLMSDTGTPSGSTENFITRDQYLEDMFFSKNAELSAVKEIIKPLKNSSEEFKNMSWDDFTKNEKIASIVDTYKVANEYKSSQSVVQSNPRLGAAVNKVQAARQAQQQGDTTTAKENAVGAVMDLLS